LFTKIVEFCEISATSGKLRRTRANAEGIGLQGVKEAFA
jgi:hypothetical protein